MPTRAFLWLLPTAVSLAAAPDGPPVPAAEAATADLAPAASDAPPTDAGFAELVKRDVVAALEQSLRRYKREVRGYRCVFAKQERGGGKLGPPEVIRATFRDDPFAVLFRWEQGGGTAAATFYGRGENGGKMLVKTTLGLTLPVPPDGRLPRQSARYSITDFGVYNGALRTYRKWAEAQKAGRLVVAFEGTRPVPEVGGRVCHVVRRTCPTPDIDSFSLEDREARDPAKHPDEQIGAVTIMLDAETWQQVGSEVRHPDGGLLGAYYFRDIEPNPTFGPEAFKLR
jgi:hypothetical protein